MVDKRPDLSPRRFMASLLLVFLVAGALRLVYPLADPPWQATVGIVWHDEGAWVHNARNRALYGAWRTDEWNPLYIAPIFTVLEYASFRAFGVGVWQARLVSEVMGLISVLALALGVAQLAGRRSGVMAGVLLATSYVYVMYDRAALMEAMMVAFIVLSWACAVRAERRPPWGAAAAAAALLAYFTKAAAVFYVVALGVSSLLTLASWLRARRAAGVEADAAARGALATIGGLVVCGILALAILLPSWDQYYFYNWQVSVTRKPTYSLEAFVDRASWFPIIHDFFTRMWLVLIVAVGAGLGALARWRRLASGERLLLLWLGLGSAELILHDVGNERRLLMLIPALIALVALALGRDRQLLAQEAAAVSRRVALTAAPLVLGALYMIFGAVLRLPFLYDTRPGVRLSAGAALVSGMALYATWPRIPRWLAESRWRRGGSLALVTLIVLGDLAQFGQWARTRTYDNYEASVALGRLLSPDTPVQGKLANGLALENRIRPIFIGRGFGNYDDRTARDDVRYILTYVSPRIGYEGPVIRDVLDAYPHWRVVTTFKVAETPSGRDQAALIDKFGGPEAGGTVPSGSDRARH